MSRNHRIIVKSVGLALASASVLALAALPSAAQYKITVSQERLLNAQNEPQNWLMMNGDYSSQRYSKLTQITRDNVKNLRLVWALALRGMQDVGQNGPENEVHPLIDNGFMYTSDGWGTLYKIDARDPNKGEFVWVNDLGVRHEGNVPRTRGFALWEDLVIESLPDGRVVAVNRDSGEPVWDKKVARLDEFGRTDRFDTAPLIAEGKVIVPAVGERGSLTALDAKTGNELWRWYAVPKPGDPGSETWKDDHNAWKTGGGNIWQTGSYDPATRLTIWGTGNPAPGFDAQFRPGDNLYTNSVVAFDIDTGKLVWYFQYLPNDSWDWDEIGVHMLYDASINGESRKVVGHFGRNGFFYTLDRNNGQFISAEQYAQKINWTSGIDPKTGKPIEYDPKKDLQVYKIGKPSRREQGKLQGCPNIQGGVNYFPTSYSRRTHLSYGGGLEACSFVTVDPLNDAAGDFWLGGKFANAEDVKGSVTTMNPSTGKKVAQLSTDHGIASGVTTTAGGLVFTTTTDGTVYALDDETLKPLWSFNTGSLSSAPPMTYAVNGKQYVAVLIGGNAQTRDLLNKTPALKDVQNTSMLFVFSL